MTLRNVPDLLMDRIKAAAQKNRRSVNQQVLIYLEQACLERNQITDVEAELAEIAALRVTGKPLSVSEIKKAIKERRK
jgi:L-serine deaminase